MTLAEDKGQTSQLQQIFLKLIEDAANFKLGDGSRSFENEEEESEPSIKAIEISQNGKVIAKGTLEQGKININKRTPEADKIAGQVEILRDLPIGTSVPSAKNIKVEIETEQGKKTLLATDENGKIIVNKFQESKMKSGLDSLKEQINQLNPKVANPMKSLLEMIEQQQQIQKQMMAQIETLTQEKQQLLEASGQRTQQPRNPRWWQKAKRNVSKIKEWRSNRQAKKWANALKTLIEDKEIDNQYVSSEYLLKKTFLEDGSTTYQLMDNQGKENLLQFKINAQGKIQIQVNQLNETDELTLNQLLEYNNRKISSLPSSFKSLTEIQMQDYRQRQIAIVQALLSNSNIERGRQYKGKKYDFLVTKRGDITITAKDSRGIILHHDADGNNNLYNLNQEDLKTIETNLSKTKAPSQSNTPQRERTTGGRRRR